jgi:methylmalonyl-CoA/ethylmalonyl-CoA epimerase
MSAESWTFHHVGIACERIEDELADWVLLGYAAEEPRFTDEIQGIRGCFMVGGGPRIELIENLAGSTTLSPWLKRKTKLYHMGYIVQDFRGACDQVTAAGAVAARDIARSAYFGARIAFFMMPNMAMIELIEASANGR